MTQANEQRTMTQMLDEIHRSCDGLEAVALSLREGEERTAMNDALCDLTSGLLKFETALKGSLLPRALTGLPQPEGHTNVFPHPNNRPDISVFGEDKAERGPERVTPAGEDRANASSAPITLVPGVLTMTCTIVGACLGVMLALGSTPAELDASRAITRGLVIGGGWGLVSAIALGALLKGESDD
ncbi:MAG: hypothetical protein VXW22_16805 [Pseudomonadota bacterium]|nr:hypothetical protein [Pseudomonadota bacterium]